MKIAVLGTKGMLAHVMIDVLSEKYDVTPISLRNKNLFDIDFSPYDVVINCVGILVKESELRKEKAVYFNTLLPHYLAHNIPGKLIHISTDCVFDNTFYGKTKLIGEIDNNRHITLRTSIIGPELNSKGTGLFNWFMNQKSPVEGYTEAIWNGVTTLQLAKCIDKVIDQNLSGKQNLVTEDGISKHNLLITIGRIFNKRVDVHQVKKGEDKRLEPTTSIRLPDYETQIKEMKEYIDGRPEMYSHYMC